jgi:hypothetical protein
LDEGYDFAIGALPVCYPNVIDVPLCPYELVAFLKSRLQPGLVAHPCHRYNRQRSTDASVPTGHAEKNIA